MILHGIEYQHPTSLNMRILADHVTYSFLAFMKSIFHFCLGCYCGGYSQNGRSNLSSFCLYVPKQVVFFVHTAMCWLVNIEHIYYKTINSHHDFQLFQQLSLMSLHWTDIHKTNRDFARKPELICTIWTYLPLLSPKKCYFTIESYDLLKYPC